MIWSKVWIMLVVLLTGMIYIFEDLEEMVSFYATKDARIQNVSYYSSYSSFPSTFN